MTQYYVNGTTGSDSYDGLSPTDDGGGVGPWATIQHSVDNATTAGDIVDIAGGTYTEQVTWNNTGTSGNPITWRAASGATVNVASSSNAAFTGTLYFPENNNTKYLVIDGLTITDSNTGLGIVVYTNGSDSADSLTFRNMVMDNQSDSRLGIVEGINHVFEDCSSDGCGDGLWIAGTNKNTQHIRITRYTFTSPAYRAATNYDGLVLQDCSDVLIEDSTLNGFNVSGNGYDGLDFGTQDNTSPYEPACDQIIVRNCTIANFRNTNIPGSATNSGNWITIYRTVQYGNGNWGSTVFYEESNGRFNFWHNTIADSATGISFNNGTGTGHVYNNILNATTFGIREESSFTINNDYNCLPDGTVSGDASPTGSNSTTSSPNYVDAANDDYHLTSTNTNLINAGRFFMSTTNSGTSSTGPINVDGDPRMFFWVGDEIQIEDVGKVTIASMTASSITLESAVTWASGKGVHDHWIGSAPDIGAYEFGTIFSNRGIRPGVLPGVLIGVR